MGIENTKQGKLLYHLTKLSNIDSILDKGLKSRKLVQSENVNFSDIADREIIKRRIDLGLDSYVPFHFHPYSSFDVAVKSNNPFDEFIYICISREVAKKMEFKILPRHPLNTEEEYKLCEYDEGFNMINWDLMHSLGTTNNTVKSVKMAECLTQKIVPPRAFQCIYVKSEETQALVIKKFKARGLKLSPTYVSVGKWL